MKNLILILSLALTIQSCSTFRKRIDQKELPPIETIKSDEVKSTPSPQATPSPTPQASPSPESSSKGYISLFTDEDVSEYYKGVFLKAEIGMNKTLQSDCFKSEMLKTKIDILQNTPSDFVKKNIKTNLQAYEYISSQKIKVNVAFYSQRFTSAVAYRSGDTILFNLRKIGGWDVMDFASTSLHESTHVMGFDHFFDPSTQRDISLPYIMNLILEKCWLP